MNRLLARVVTPFRIWWRKIDELEAYHLRWAIYISSVPLISSLILVLLMFVFAKLNLFLLESTGMVIDERLRSAYYDMIAMEISDDLLLIALLISFTFAAGWVAVRWATSPFRDAEKLIWTSLHEPAALRAPRKWLSESPEFEALLWSYAQRLSGKQHSLWTGRIPVVTFNPLFSLKFLAVFGPLSVVTGFFLGNVLTSAYTKVISMAVSLTRDPGAVQHYFISQQEILVDATVIVSSFAFLAYLLMGMSISRYMATMIFVFGRGVVETRFPLKLRGTDIYNSLANTLNEADQRLRPNGAARQDPGHLT